MRRSYAVMQPQPLKTATRQAGCNQPGELYVIKLQRRVCYHLQLLFRLSPK
jgi:hypothetical protein